MKKILFAIIIFAIMGAGVGVLIYNKPHKKIEDAPVEASLKATELFKAYETDEAAANAKYLDQVIAVTGTVQSTKTDEDGNVGVTLEGGDMMFGVICKLDPLSDHARTDFETGETVTMKGICTGALMDVVLERCIETGP